MSEKFPIFEISPEAPEESEAMGTKEKLANIWLDNLEKISPKNTLRLFQRIPDNCISSTAIQFAQRILEINQNKLLEFSQEL